MPEKQAQLDPANGVVTVSIGPGALHIVQYTLYVYDAAGANILERFDGFITDKRMDDIQLATPPAALNGCALCWLVHIITQLNTGQPEPYQVFVEVSQNGTNVPGGDIYGPPNQGTFTTAFTYADYVRLLG